MDDIVALCKRRGFIFPASEIYQGINGFWDYGPLGIELKNNLRDAWWNRMVRTPPLGPDGEPLQIVGVDTSIIQNPRVWEASGHVGGFNDPMVDCRQTKARYRYDHLRALRSKVDPNLPLYAFMSGEPEVAFKKLKKLGQRGAPENWEELALTDLPVSELPRVVGQIGRAHV
jgi:glycyl-tRNA synthetase